jgi:CDP-glucose 4,6-dehydratase
MEALVVTPGFWSGRRVLVTGHTGFKGAWLCQWLYELGAQISAVSLPPETDPSLYSILGLGRLVVERLFDINDGPALAELLAEQKPEIIFHLAAQALVRRSYQQPVETFATNVLGIVTLLDAVRRCPSVRAVVVVTTDKCYENDETRTAFREVDRLGGRDAYSASKACGEIATQSMRNSFFAPYVRDGHAARIATARAGNVIGGGDWAEDRLIPDIVRACLERGGAVRLRNPTAVRPWQHVLEPLRGYFDIAERLVTDPDKIDEAWNLGPDDEDARSVHDVAAAMTAQIGRGSIILNEAEEVLHEAHFLSLDCQKAKLRIGWRPALRFVDAMSMTAEWYNAWAKNVDMMAFTRRQIADYSARAGALIAA